MSAAPFSGEVPCGRCSRPLPPGSEGATLCFCGASQRVLRFHPFRRPAAPAAAVFEAAQTPCAYHLGNAASAACSRCGSFVCALCATPVAGTTWCPPCFERQRRNGQLEGVRGHVPTPHLLALGLGLAALVLPWLSFAFAPLGFWQTWRALRTRDELELRDNFVRTRALVGAACGLLGLSLLGLIVWAAWSASRA